MSCIPSSQRESHAESEIRTRSGPLSEYIPQAGMMSFAPINAIHQHRELIHASQSALSQELTTSCVYLFTVVGLHPYSDGEPSPLKLQARRSESCSQKLTSSFGFFHVADRSRVVPSHHFCSCAPKHEAGTVRQCIMYVYVSITIERARERES